MQEEKITCPHNAGVDCLPSQKCCDRCGWNPEVEKDRLKKMGITLEERKTPEK